MHDIITGELMERVDAPHSATDLESLLTKLYRFRNGTLWPDGEQEFAILILKTLSPMMDNFSFAIAKALKNMETKGYELGQIKLEEIAKRLQYNSRSQDIKNTSNYRDYIEAQICSFYYANGLCDEDMREHSEKFNTVESIVNFLSERVDVVQQYNKTVNATRASELVFSSTKDLSKAVCCMKASLRKMNFSEKMKKIAKPDLRDLLLAYQEKYE